MHELPLLTNITVALVVAFIGGVAARRLRLPTIVGYLLAGIAIGPFTPGFVGDSATIRQLAELGVIFLMFGVGLHFSFADLWRVRDIAVPGALVHTVFASALAFALTQLWGWTVSAGLVLGLAVSVASTVVLLRGLMDNNLLNTSHGQAAVGVLVMEDIFSVLILVLMPTLAAGSSGFDWQSMAITLVKAAAFVAIMFVAGVRLIPRLLEAIAHTRSRELFILAILAITLGVAMSASQLFGVSLALGAFVAGAIISESHLSHQVGADTFAFRESFSALFFVSVGMLVDPLFLWVNLGSVTLLTFLVVVGKAAIAILMGLALPGSARTYLIMGIGLGQVGEFSFILGEAGLSLDILVPDQYSLVLAAALISNTINPFLWRLTPRLEAVLRRVPAFWAKLESRVALPQIVEERLVNHVVVIGYGRVGSHLVDVLHSLHVPLLVIEADAERNARLNEQRIPALYGDAGNSEVITHAHLERARALVSTVPDETTAVMIVVAARDINPDLPIFARAATEEGVKNLSRLGAHHVVHPELEGVLELLYQTLLNLGFPMQDVHEYAEAVRREHYAVSLAAEHDHRSLNEILHASDRIQIAWVTLDADSPLLGKSLGESNIRTFTGASVVALVRDKRLIANPKSATCFEEGDRMGLIGESEQIEAARELVEA